ncbi:MAG: hypothetical protein KDA24_25465 [Deltaproteobacteria bacterium]|nr:hypothetical protein [Deltaproteobacteria bacterium]
MRALLTSRQRHLALVLVTLLLGVWALAGCDTRRRSSSSDDDDASSNDDDSSSDDDDATGDDDDTPPSPGVLQVTADANDLGSVAAAAEASTVVHFENVGGTSVQATLSLSDNSGIWTVDGTVVNIAPFTTEDRALTFVGPALSGPYQLSLNVLHDGSNPSPQQLVFTATALGLESNCSDGIDNDNNGATDCYDQNCVGDPSCNGQGGDPCCDENFAWGLGPCWVPTHEQCVCGEDVFCCTDWDGTCGDIYTGSVGACGASGTCN